MSTATPNLDDVRAHWRGRFTSLPPTVDYTESCDYRATMRKVFQFDAEARVTEFGGVELDPDVVMDAETADEVAFDEATMERALSDWFALTEDDADFLELYTHAAYTMMSTNPVVGQCVVAGYHTFPDYYACVRAFLEKTNHRDVPKYNGSMARLHAYFRPRDTAE